MEKENKQLSFNFNSETSQSAEIKNTIIIQFQSKEEVRREIITQNIIRNTRSF